jgi:type II restriction enzyme
MKTNFDLRLAEKYSNASQKIKAVSEGWVGQNIFCPACGAVISHFENNRPVADFYCDACKEEYELKSGKNSMGKKIVDGAYRTMIERLESDNNPNFFFLNYDLKNFAVMNFMVIPKHFFVSEIIEQRKPLSLTARRAGWVGCNIILQNIPQTGKIFYIKNGKLETKKEILSNWQKTLFLRKEKKKRGWILDAMKCVEKIGKQEFSLDEVYVFEKELKTKYPDNNFIKDKLRQQLQLLRDEGYLEFVSRGRYRLAI